MPGGETIWWLLFIGLTLVVALEIYWNNTPGQKAKRHRYCRYCGKVMMFKHTYNMGRVTTFLVCSVMEYDSTLGNLRRHDVIDLGDKGVPANYDPTTGRFRGED